MPTKNLVNRLYSQNYCRGFGLVELLVSISIMVLVTSIVMTRHDSFNRSTLLRGQAYEVALAVREMQLLAVSATKGEDGFNNVYGLVFNTNANSYIIFTDKDKDFVFDAGDGEQLGKPGVIDPRFQISAIRLIGSVEVSTITVMFKRPNFDAILYEGASAVATSVPGIEIDIEVKGANPPQVRTIEITKTGQITVKDIP